MKHSTFNYLRALRDGGGLTEEELAFLIDYGSRTTISLIESGDRVPKLEAALALQVLFGMPPRKLFGELYEQIEDAVMRRGQRLYEKVQHATDARSKAIRLLLEDMARRRDEDNDIAL